MTSIQESINWTDQTLLNDAKNLAKELGMSFSKFINSITRTAIENSDLITQTDEFVKFSMPDFDNMSNYQIDSLIQEILEEANRIKNKHDFEEKRPISPERLEILTR